MASVRIEWNGREALEAVAEATDIGLGAAANVIASEMTARMGTEGGGVVGLQRGQINRMGAGRGITRHRRGRSPASVRGV